MVYNFITFVQIERIMKKLLLIVSVFMLIVSCSKDDIDTKGTVRKGAMISIYAKPQTKADYLSPLEFVEQTTNICLYNRPVYGDKPIISYTFNNTTQKDLNPLNPRLMMMAHNIIDENTGEYVPHFVEAEDLVFVKVIYLDETHSKYTLDTTGYIPNSELRNAATLIKAAYNDQNYNRCYKLFDSLFVARQIDGKGWRELKAQGLN